MKLPSKVSIVEVGPRDGFQNEKILIETDKKVKLIDLLVQAGLNRIEATSFVHPQWIPQLRDAEEVMSRIDRRAGVQYSALVPNKRGYLRARACGIQEINLIVSASDSHNKKNLNKTVADSMKELVAVMQMALEDGILVRASIGTSFGCPIEGPVSPQQVLDLAGHCAEGGAGEIVLADTIGVGNPLQVYNLFSSVSSALPGVTLAAHFHDTRGMGIANVMAAMEAGVTLFDASTGGLGGCPYAPGATGNIPTEDVVNALEQMGIQTGTDLSRLKTCAHFLREVLDRPLDSHLSRVWFEAC